MTANRKSQSVRQRRAAKRRSERLAKKTLIRRRYDRDHLYPQARIEKQLASPSFSELVQRAISSIDLTDPELFPEGCQEYFRVVRASGHVAAQKFLLRELGHRATTEAGVQRIALLPAISVGIILIDRLLDLDNGVFPTNDVEVHFSGREIVLALSSMLRRSVNGQTVFHSQQRLSVERAGKNYVVAFTQHAIEQICDRFKPDYTTYLGLGDAHALFSYLAYAEMVELRDGGPALAIFDLCSGPGHWEYDAYVRGCMPEAPTRGIDQWINTFRPYGYRVGYCPVVLTEGYAIAKTFLPPGFSKTPERELIERKVTDMSERNRLIKIASGIGYHSLRKGDGMVAIKWFHDNGVPQVIDPPEPLFDQDYLERKIGVNRK